MEPATSRSLEANGWSHRPDDVPSDPHLRRPTEFQSPGLASFESAHCQRSRTLLDEFAALLEPLNDILVSDANGRREESDAA